MRWLGQAVVLAGAAAMCACGQSRTNPTAPTPPTTTTVAAMTVTARSTSGESFQLTATARMSDGSSVDVTGSATWQSSNPQLATVSSTGLVTAHGTGEVDLRATYQGVTGSLHANVSATRAFTISGVVSEAAPNARPIAGVRVQLLPGGFVSSDDKGAFAISAVPPGRALIEFSKDGYEPFETDVVLVDRDVQLPATLYPTPPKNAAGVTATARCNDGSWSWATTRADACVANGGIAYTVCPGALCTQ